MGFERSAHEDELEGNWDTVGAYGIQPCCSWACDNCCQGFLSADELPFCGIYGFLTSGYCGF